MNGFLEMIKIDHANFAVIKEDALVTYSDIIEDEFALEALYKKNPEELQDSLFVGRIIGKKTAELLVKGKTKSVYGLVMSAVAIEYLEMHNINVEFGLSFDGITSHDQIA